jgi:membrane protease YdiL (CAAX protease family)
MNSLKRRKVFELVFVPAFAFLPSILYSLQLFFAGSEHVSYTNQSASVEYGIFYECLSLALLYYVLRGRRETFRDLGMSLTWRDGIAGMILALIVYLFTYGFQWFLIRILPPSFYHYLHPANTDFIPAGFSGLFFVYLLLNPFREELIVRGFVMRETFSFTYNKTFTVVISVLVQTSYHLYQGLLPALILSVVFSIFSVYYVKTSRLTPVVVAHLIMDFAAYIFYVYR